MTGLGTTPYRCIVADPPWCATLGGSWMARVDRARPQKYYAMMSVEDICSLTIPSAPQAHLYLWCIAQHVDYGYRVARAWGFEPIIVWTWAKAGLGMGRFQCNTEHVLVARKGSRQGNPFGPCSGTCFQWPRGKHSKKPSAFYALVEQMSPGPRLDLFARQVRAGWDGYGDQYPGRSITLV